MDTNSNIGEIEKRVEKAKQVVNVLAELGELKREIRMWTVVTAVASFVVLCVMLVQLLVGLQDIIKVEGTGFRLFVDVGLPWMCVFGVLAMFIHGNILRKRKKKLESKFAELM